MNNKTIEKLERLTQISPPSKSELEEILSKAKEAMGITIEETAKLLQVQDQESLVEIYKAAGEVKNEIYGKRVVLFAPLYLSSYCSNNCLYCGFRRDNEDIHRKRLTIDEIIEEVTYLEKSGHKRLLIVAGEHEKLSPVTYVSEVIGEIYKQFDIRRINVNIAPLTKDEYKVLKESGIGTYQLFQETYHPDTYKRMHPQGKKADYHWRYSAFERAIEAGIEDIGMGALFGLYNYKFEVMALIEHGNQLMEKYSIGPHTISIPRLRPAVGSLLKETPYPLADWEFKKMVAVLRLSVPYTGIILSTREKSQLRDELLDLGVSQISAGSHTNPGGYKEDHNNNGQFQVEDHRNLDQMVSSICESGYIPSFCTACYRKSRTGESFMELARFGDIKELCQANALLTLKENLIDYASENTRNIGKKLIKSEIENIPDSRIKKLTEDKLLELEQGKRDLYF